MRASKHIRQVVAWRGNITAAEYARILRVKKANAGKQPIAEMQGSFDDEKIIVSSCCGARIIENTDLCSDCKEHCSEELV